MQRALWVVVLLSGCQSAAKPPRVVAASAPIVPSAAMAPTPAAATPAAPIAPARDIGTAHPLTLQELDPDGRWLVICQARSDTDGDGKIDVDVGHHGDLYGDAMVPYLVFGDGPGDAIDTFVSRSRDGRWLAVIRNKALELVDANVPGAPRTVVLTDADLRDDGFPFGDARAAAIADGGARMTYFRHTAAGDRIVIRELATGGERAVDVAGQGWRMWVTADGRWAKVGVQRAGAAFPRVGTSLSARGCRGPILSYSTYGMSGERPREQWLDLERATWVAADKLPRDIEKQFDSPRDAPELQAACDEHGACVDRPGGAAIAHPEGDVEYVAGALVVLRQGKQRFVFDADRRTTTPLAATGAIGNGEGRFLAIGDGVYDLRHARRVGDADAAVLADTPTGALIGHDPPGNHGLPRGPLRWAR